MCEHPGVFATDNPTEFCGRCGRDIPVTNCNDLRS